MRGVFIRGVRWHLLSGLLVMSAVALGLYISSLNNSSAGNGYRGIVQAWSIFYTLGPILSGYAAWDTSRFRPLLAQRRRPLDLWKLIGRRQAFPMLLGMALVLLSMGWFGGMATTQAWSGILITVISSLLWTSLGIVAALYLPLIFSILVALFTPFLLIAYPPAFSDVAWRQMFGQANGGCCSTDYMIDPVLLRSSLVTLSFLLLSCLVLISFRYFSHRVHQVAIAAAVVSVAVALIIGHAMGATGNYSSATPRSESELQCEGQLCIWPETRRDIASVNLRILRRLDIADDIILVDRASYGDQELRLIESTDERAVAIGLVAQLVAQDPILKRTTTCWSEGDDSTPMSVADVVGTGFELEVLEKASLFSDGRFKGYGTGSDGIDREPIVREVLESCAM